MTRLAFVSLRQPCAGPFRMAPGPSRVEFDGVQTRARFVHYCVRSLPQVNVPHANQDWPAVV